MSDQTLLTFLHHVMPPVMAVKIDIEYGRERHPLRSMKTMITKVMYFTVSDRSLQVSVH